MAKFLEKVIEGGEDGYQILKLKYWEAAVFKQHLSPLF